jgi:hypothetical protein
MTDVPNVALWLVVLLGSPGAPDAETPASAAPAARLTHVTMDWGTVGVSVPPDAGLEQPAWAAGFIDLEVLRPLAGLRLESLRLLAPDGTTVATATAELELRAAAADRSPIDLSAYETVPPPNELASGTRLRLRVSARLTPGFDRICSTLCTADGPRYELVLATAAGERLRLAGPLGPPWPTA